MLLPAESRWHNDEQGIARLAPPARPVRPAEEDGPALLAWALAAAAAAEQRIADLEGRLAQLESLSVTDELTGVLNRRGFLAELTRASAAAARGGPQGVLIICDLDGFKAINDLYGHRTGNEILHQVAAMLRARVRKNDVVGRLGGDEFALLLIGAGLANGRRRCQALERALAEAPPAVDGAPIPLRASFGAVPYRGEEDQEALLHGADMAMYEVKRRRRAALDHGLK